MRSAHDTRASVATTNRTLRHGLLAAALLAAVPGASAGERDLVPRWYGTIDGASYFGHSIEWPTGLRLGPSQAGALNGWDLADGWRLHGTFALVAPRIGCNGYDAYGTACGPLESTTQSAREYALQVVLSRIRTVRTGTSYRMRATQVDDDASGSWKLSVNSRRLTVRYVVRF